MHRIAFAALAAFIAAIFAAAPIGAAPADAQTERAATSTGPTLPRARLGTRTPGAVQATNSISCNDANGKTRTYTVSVTGGNCVTYGSGSGRGVMCRGGGDEASANCSRGCGDTSGEGSCTQTTR